MIGQYYLGQSMTFKEVSNLENYSEKWALELNLDKIKVI